MVFKAFIRIDMALVDERVFEVICRKLAGRRSGILTSSDIAEEIRCHPNTVQRATKRLVAAGKIVTENHGRIGSEYSLVET